MKKCSDFLTEVRGNYRYLFFLLYEDTLLSNLREVIEKFAQKLNPMGGVVIEPYSDQATQNYEKVCSSFANQLPPELQNLDHPKLLVLETALSEFDPNQHKFRVIDFDDYGGDPIASDEVLKKVANVVNAEEDFFGWWERNGPGFRLSDQELQQGRFRRLNERERTDRSSLLNSKFTFTIEEAAYIADVDERTIRNHLDNPDRYPFRRNPQGRITQQSLKEYLGL